ncbi:MAG TPA: HEAT repeat domain-containing protein [Pyrinomonadaceae bacterium]
MIQALNPFHPSSLIPYIMPSSLEATLDRVERLASSGSAADVRQLVRLLGNEDWQTRRAAAEAISSAVQSRPPDSDTETLLDELIAAVSDHHHAGRRAAAVVALEGIGARALPRLSAELLSAPASARIALAGVIGSVGGIEAVRLLEPLVLDADTNVATATIAALGRTRHTAATQILLNYLDAEDDWLRFSAVGALGELGDERAIERIEGLLEEPIMQEAAAAALVEVSTVSAARALARHLRAADGTLRPVVLAALVSLSNDERPEVPRAISEKLREVAQRALRETADDATFGDILRMTSTGDPEIARVGLTALGWMGAVRAVPIIGSALSDPALSKTARRALADLSQEPQALGAMLEVESVLISPAEVAAAISNTRSLVAIEAAARLSTDAADAETLEASITALVAGRLWLREQRAELLHTSDAARLGESLRNLLRVAHNRALLEIAETLGVLAAALAPALPTAIAEELSHSVDEDHILARLAFLDNVDPLRAAEEATRAQRHRSSLVRMSAIEILSWRADSREPFSLTSHLTDESAGVRRAATRAMRRGAPSAEARRALLAAVADEDIWVRSEAISTLGALFGSDAQVRTQLREQLDAPHPLCRVAAAFALSALADARDWRSLAQMARRDAQAEARRAAVLAFAHCEQPRTLLSVMRTAIRDTAWPVRRAAVEVLASSKEASAQRLLLEMAGEKEEEPAVRGAALRALADHHAPETIGLVCLALSRGDATLTEDAYAALLTLKPSGRTREEMRTVSKTCPPRVAAIINTVTTDE